MTQTIKAADLADYQRRYFPLFIDDNVPQDGLDGPAHFARKVQTINDYIRSAAGRDQITIEFTDGTPGRLFDHEDDVVVRFIMLGTDVLQAKL
ncbi:hypothetical protein [Mycolicibacterium lutetiense]